MIQCPDTRQWSYILYVKTLNFKRQPEFQTFWDPRNHQMSSILFTQSYQRLCFLELRVWDRAALIESFQSCSTMKTQGYSVFHFVKPATEASLFFSRESCGWILQWQRDTYRVP